MIELKELAGTELKLFNEIIEKIKRNFNWNDAYGLRDILNTDFERIKYFVEFGQYEVREYEELKKIDLYIDKVIKAIKLATTKIEDLQDVLAEDWN